eukprot:1009804-Rhodomonas_salina.7
MQTGVRSLSVGRACKLQHVLHLDGRALLRDHRFPAPPPASKLAARCSVLTERLFCFWIPGEGWVEVMENGMRANSSIWPGQTIIPLPFS